MELRLPNKHWFDIIQLLVGHEEPHRLWYFYYTKKQDKHGAPILRTESIWVSPMKQSVDGGWYIKVSPYKAYVSAFACREVCCGIETDFPAFRTCLYKAGDFPWDYHAKHGLYTSKRQALKALHLYEQALIECNFDDLAADKVYDDWRFGAKSAQEERVNGTAKQVDGFEINDPVEGEFGGNKGEQQ